MSKNTISVQISDVSSSQDWTVDPDMVEIEVGAWANGGLSATRFTPLLKIQKMTGKTSR